MSRSPIFGTVAAVSFAGDDCRSQHALCQVVGRLQVVDIQEAQEVWPMLTQAFGKAGILRIGEAAGGGDQEYPGELPACEPVARTCEA